MLSYFFEIYKKLTNKKKNKKRWTPKVVKAKNWKSFNQTAFCGGRKSRFINEQKASGLLISLGIRKPLRNIPLIRPFLI